MGVLGGSQNSAQVASWDVLFRPRVCQVQMEDKQVEVDPPLRAPLSLFWAGV